MKPILEILQSKLNKRIKDGSYRELHDFSNLIDFSSNDYLGFSKSEGSENLYGATGSRLISGNSNEIEHLELEIASFHGAQSGLIFNSGYTANLGLFSTIPRRGDTVIYDELIHASIRDGIKLSNATSFSFNHNDYEHLEKRLMKGNGAVFVAIESVYSMDGDSPDLKEVVRLCNLYNANLIVDEAHAIGVVGDSGEGMLASLKLQKEVFATVATFGKALGAHGAIVLGDNVIRNYLINFCRPFIYTTAPSPESIATIRKQYSRLKELYASNGLESNIAFELKKYFINNLSNSFEVIYGDYGSIVSVVIPGNDKVKSVSKSLEKKGLFVKSILSPTVQEGRERLRICFHSYNSINEVNTLIKAIESTT